MQKVAKTRPDMVIKTTRHDTAIHRTFFNYTDWHLIRHCPCPLMLAKKEDDWETRRVVACVDPAHIHSKAETLDNAIIEASQLLACRLRGELHILHSIELLPESATPQEDDGSSYGEYKGRVYGEHQTLLDELLRPYGVGSQKVHMVAGNPAKTIVPLVEEIGASVVVMGAVSKGTLETLFIGNTAEKVLDDLSCDVLVVKSKPVEVRITELAGYALA
jgi:universal stress protein E